MTDLWHALDRAFAQEVGRIARPVAPAPISPGAVESERPRGGDREAAGAAAATFPAPSP